MGYIEADFPAKIICIYIHLILCNPSTEHSQPGDLTLFYGSHPAQFGTLLPPDCNWTLKKQKRTDAVISPFKFSTKGYKRYLYQLHIKVVEKVWAVKSCCQVSSLINASWCLSAVM